MQAMKNFREAAEKYVKTFSLFDKRRKALILLFAGVAVFSLYYNLAYKPQAAALRKARLELSDVDRDLSRLKAQFPDVKGQAQKLDKAKKNLEALKSQLASIESELPTQGSIPQLLNGLVRQAQGYSIDFTSIRPKPPKEKKEYFEQDIEIRFNTTYSDFTNYINRLESPAQFLRATNIMMENIKGAFSGGIDTTLTLTTLLSAEPAVKTAKEEAEALVEPIEIERSPFVPEHLSQAEQAKSAAYRLTGIVSTGMQPTAIINDDVYKIGDTIDNKVVTQILPNMVVLSYGKEKIMLSLEKNNK